MNDCAYEELGHTSEVGLRVHAATAASLFACAARAMFALIGAQPAQSGASRQVMVESLDTEGLLVDWLSELLYLHETSGEVYDSIEITAWAPTRLDARITGGPPHDLPLHAIKAVTYYGLRLAEEDGAWVAEVYFDI